MRGIELGGADLAYGDALVLGRRVEMQARNRCFGEGEVKVIGCLESAAACEPKHARYQGGAEHEHECADHNVVHFSFHLCSYGLPFGEGAAALPRGPVNNC